MRHTIHCCNLLALLALTNLCDARERPNIILILADDLGFETVSCYGGQSYATPNLDRLAAGGLRFDRAYAMPLCTNTRIQLMTGKYNIRNWKAFGILAPEQKTFGHLMQAAGYKTCIAGKWQLTSYDPPDYPGADLRRNSGMRVEDSGFDETSLWHTGHTEDKGSRYPDPVIEQNGSLLTNTDGKYGPDIWTDFIGDFMREHREEPFFVYYSMALPHNPMNPTPDSPEWADPAMRHQDITRFAKDMIEYTDKMVGKVVAKVDELGLRDDTLVLFFSDNGTNWRVRSSFREQEVGGEKGKGTELGVRVPMIANWPGNIQAAKTSQALIDSVDFLPTLLDTAGRTDLLPGGVDGQSFLPILRGDESDIRKYVMIHQDPRPGWDKDRFQVIRLAINQRFKLYQDGRLFDLQEDFFERAPMWPASDSADQRRARQELQSVLDSHLPKSNFDPHQVPRPDPHAVFQRHAFQAHSNGNLIVVEAEQIPFARDESWAHENHAPRYTGIGYLRTLRSLSPSLDAKADNRLGEAIVRLIVETAGEYRMALRVRSDRVDDVQPSRLLVRQLDQSDWRSVELNGNDSVGRWQWVDLGSVQLSERANSFAIAPGTANVKLDRIVFYRQGWRDQALDVQTPASQFHPWASP